jgi:hypothetical protein
MNKRMRMLPLIVLLLVAFAQPVSADSSEITAWEKFQALKEAGIFDGFANDTADDASDDSADDPADNTSDDSAMTRAQLAKIFAVMLGLDQEEISEEELSRFSDVDKNYWASAFIALVNKHKLMQGVGDGIFAPEDRVTLEQMATVMVRALNLPVDESGSVEGNVSDWAKGYVAAALANGLLKPADDYTVPADRNTLVEASYTTNTEIVEQNGFGITAVSQTGARRIAVSLNDAPDPSDVEITVVRLGYGASVGVESLEWSEYGRQVVVRLAEPLNGGPHKVTISGSDSIDPSRSEAVFTAEAERVAKLKWGGPDTLPHADDVEVPFLVLNQFDEPMEPKDAKFSFAASNASIERIPDRAAVLLHLLAKAQPGGKVSLVIAHADTRLSATKTYQVGESRVVSAIEIGGVPADPLESGSSAELIVRVYDQYGGLITDAEWLNRELVAESGSSRLLSVSSLAKDGSGNIVVRATAGLTILDNETVNITVRSRSGSVGATATLTVKARERIAPIVFIPPGNPTVTDGVYTTGINFAYVTIETDDATKVHYYYEKKGSSPDVPSATEVLVKALTSPQGGSATVMADRASFVLLDLDTDADGETYELFVVAADAWGRHSAVQTYEFATNPNDSTVMWQIDPSVEDSTLGRIFSMPAGSHYMLTREPIPGITADDIRENGDEADTGLVPFLLDGQVYYLYVAYEYSIGVYQLFAYASADFPVRY